MSQYYGVSRSNYVRFKTPKKVAKICGYYELVLQKQKDKWVIIPSDDNEFGDAANSITLHDDTNIKEMQSLGLLPKTGYEDNVELPDFLDTLCQYLADEEVLIWISSGHEKLRYIGGYAIAINNKGKRKEINISHITTLAKSLGKNITEPEY